MSRHTEPTLTAFNPDAALALPGPDWLRNRRREAAQRFEQSNLPSATEEVWRYSRIDELDLHDFSLEGGARADAPVPVSEPVPMIDVEAVLHGLVDHAMAVVLHNGVLVGGAVNDDATTVGPVDDPDLLGSVSDEPADVFGVLNDAFVLTPLHVRIPAGKRIERPIVVVNHVDQAGAAVFPRLVVSAEAGSEATVVDVTVSPDGVVALVVPVVELDVAQGARLAYVNQQLLGRDTWQIGSQVSRVGQEANLVSATAGFGGDYARQRTDCRMVGRGASSKLLAVYFGEGQQTLDFRTFQDHAAPDTQSELLYKGVVGGSSRSVYTGLIRVRKDARGTNAFQTNRNIKLSEDAWAESVPNLEIENNDVRCSHASAVGPIDEEQRFYLESRGVPPEAADRLIVTGFFDEVLEQLPVPAVATELRQIVSEKLARTQAEIDSGGGGS